MAQLRDEFEEFLKLETVVVVVGPEDAPTFKTYWTDNNLPFIGLPNPTHTVLKLYGQEVKLLKLGRMPASFIIDRTGLIRFVHYGHSMSDIPSNQDVLQTLRSLNTGQNE
jgi:peroxiredoxin